MGTPDFAVPTLSEIVTAGHDVLAVVTQPPKPAGRGLEPRRSSVHRFADEAGIPVLTPKGMRKPRIQEKLHALGADVGVVVAYGVILPAPVLNAPRFGCFNLHGSLLPRWRGAAPIQRAIMYGDPETGVSVMRMDEGLDTGPVCMEQRIAISYDMTAHDLHDQLALMGAAIMVKALAALAAGTLKCRKQPDQGVTYAEKISNDEARIDWNRPSHEVHNLIRSLSPHPGAWFEALLGGKIERIKVLRSVEVPGRGEPGKLLDGLLTVACGTNSVRLTLVQRAGKKIMGGADFLRGFPLGKGTHFG
jgi:methionyl-tRNA formyltransferase